MPDKDTYEVSKMTLKRRGDGCCGDVRILKDVQFEYSTDGGKTFQKHANGKWFPTGQTGSDKVEQEREIEINPPMRGNAFRVVIDKAHK